MAETGSGVVALGIVDIVGSGNWLQRLGDERYGALLDAIKDAWAEVILRHGAGFVSDTGDGCIVAHDSVETLVEVSFEMHAALAVLPTDIRVETRHAVHCGPVVQARYALCGASIYETVDLGDVAEGGHLWISEAAAARPPRRHDGAWREVDLPRSGRHVVYDIDLRRQALAADPVPALTIAL